MNKIHALTLALAGLLGLVLQAATIEYDMTVKGPLDSPTSWVGGVIPTADDTVLVQAEQTSQSISLAAPGDLTWGGFAVDAGSNKTFTVKLTGTGAQSLYLGKEGLNIATNMSSSSEIQPTVRLTADQTWTLQSGTVAFTNRVNLQEHTLTLASGGATKDFKMGFVGPGTIIGEAGFRVYSKQSAVATDLSLRSIANATAQFLGYSTVPRVNNVSQDLGYNTFDLSQNDAGFKQLATTQMDGSLYCNFGLLYVNVSQSAAYKHILNSMAYNHTGGMTLFKGTNLGTIDLDTTTGQSANIIFHTPPTLLGDQEGIGSQMPIMKGAVADTTTAGRGMGFATYDETYGVRLLDFETEYDAELISGQDALNNVRLTTADAPLVTTLTDALTTVNSLTLINTGPGDLTGITINGDLPNSTLRVASGMIYAQQTVSGTATTNDAIILQVPFLDFNNQAGLIFVRDTKGTSNGNAKGALRIKSIFTNVAPEGITFHGPIDASWPVYLENSTENSYTGRITVGRGVYLRPQAATANTAIRGTLVINGGGAQYYNQLDDDTSDIILYCGSSLIRAGDSNSGSGGSEVFRNFTMFGGGHTLGADSGGTQGNQNLYLYGGTFTMYRSTRMNVAHDVMLAGTVMTIRSNSASDRSGPIFTIGDTLTISNTVETAQYIPMTIGWSTYRNAPTLVLSNQLVFVGNAINTNSTLIKREYNLAEETAKHAECALNGTVVFDIGDGAAVNDLEMDLTFADDATGSSAVPGRLVKEGAGTLMITSATNTLTGGIEINAGTLAVSGYFASGMSVAEEATLRVDTATVEINGDLMFEHNSTYAVSTLGAKTVVNGAVSGTGITWVTSPMPASNVSQVHLMHASGGMTQKFKTELPGWHCSVVGGTDLYLKPMPATILVY